MKLVLSDFIESDLDEIAEYIARHSPRYAVKTIQRIRKQFRVIAAGPYHYPYGQRFGLSFAKQWLAITSSCFA